MRYFILLFVFFLSSGFAHKFYVSITEVNYNTENKSLEISIKLFTDDLEAALEEGTTKKLWIGDEREAPETDSLLATYLNKKFNIHVNDEAQIAAFLGKELEADVTWCYLEIMNVSDIKNITVNNRIFMELFDDQKNLVAKCFPFDQKEKQNPSRKCLTVNLIISPTFEIHLAHEY